MSEHTSCSIFDKLNSGISPSLSPKKLTAQDKEPACNPQQTGVGSSCQAGSCAGENATPCGGLKAHRQIARMMMPEMPSVIPTQPAALICSLKKASESKTPSRIGADSEIGNTT